MKVLVAGSDGYLGTLLTPLLLERGHDVLGLDTGFYRSGWLYEPGTASPRTRTMDVRSLQPDDLEGFDAVVHMADLSNDPLGELAPDVTDAINHIGARHLARSAKAAGIERFVYMSSCSVYGYAEGSAPVDESATPNPLTAYARCKVLMEAELADLADDDFSPTCMRNATAFGASPRMRFDLVLNNLAGVAWTTKEVKVLSDGTPWRPLVHAADIGRAICAVLEAERSVVHGEIFNVGDSDQNYQVKEIAEAVAAAFPDATLSFGAASGDNRSYRVSFDKIQRLLPDFKCEWSVERGAMELRHLFEQIQLSSVDFTDRRYTRLAQLQHLLATGQIDDTLRWSAP
jgi:nucleoside-diphosphate-sugar epimerase